MKKKTGYQEIDHTADWELRVWGPEMISLLETAAQGMYELSGIKIATDPSEVRNFEIPLSDRESLLVDFLSELLFFGEDEGIAFNEFDICFLANTLRVQAIGGSIQEQTKEIKAVTYHHMQIHEFEGGLEVRIVFDV